MANTAIALVTLTCLHVARGALIEAIGESRVAIEGDTAEPTVHCESPRGTDPSSFKLLFC